jgi:hypothetical protein
MKAEMELVFEQKVKEKILRLKESELNVSLIIGRGNGITMPFIYLLSNKSLKNSKRQ